MKEFLDKFGLAEALGYLFPGVMALCALLLWGIPPPSRFLGTEIGKNEFLMGTLLLILAYAIGLVISMTAISGLRNAQQASWPEAERPEGRSWPELIALAAQWVERTYIVGARTPAPATIPANVEAVTDVTQILERIYGVHAMPLMPHTTMQLSILRAIASDRLKEKIAAPLQEAETQHRRYMFALGVALSLVVLASSALTRALVDLLAHISPQILPPGPSIWWGLLVCLAVCAMLSSAWVWPFRGWGAILIVCTSVLCLALALLGTAAARFGDALLPISVILLALSMIGFAISFRALVQITHVLMVVFLLPLLVLLASAFLMPSSYWLADLRAWNSRHPSPWWALVVLAVAAFYMSSRLRDVAAQALERELTHTLVIVRLFGHYF